MAYQVGHLIHIHDDDPIYADEGEALRAARQLSENNPEQPYGVWNDVHEEYDWIAFEGVLFKQA